MTAEFSALAIETSTEACSVAACAGDRISMREYASSQTGSRHIFELINEILDEIRQSLQSLDCVAFGCGPGGVYRVTRWCCCHSISRLWRIVVCRACFEPGGHGGRRYSEA